MIQFMKRCYGYIYASVFYAEIEAEEAMYRAYLIECATQKMADAIDRDILENDNARRDAIDEANTRWVSEKYAKAVEESTVDHLILGHAPKIFVMPSAIEIDGGIRTMTYRWGVGHD